MSKENVKPSPKKAPFNKEKFVQECERLAQERRQVRKKTVEAEKNRPNDKYFQGLDSNIKKNTAIVKRIRTFAELQPDQKLKLLPDIEKQNLRRYVSEIVQALVPPFPEDGVADVLVQDEDIVTLAYICCRLHQLYAEFTSTFIPVLLKYHVKSSSSSSSDQPNGSSSNITIDFNRLRVTIRLLAELFMLGVLPDNQHLFSTIKASFATLAKDQPQEKKSLTIVLNLILGFLKYHGEEYCGASQSLLDASDEEEKIRREHQPFVKAEERVVSVDDQTRFRDFLNNLLKQACDILHREHMVSIFVYVAYILYYN